MSRISKTNVEEELKFYWFCPQCQGILQQKKGSPGGGKFVLHSKSMEVGIKNAVSGKRMNQSAIEDARRVAHEYFQRANQNSAHMMGVICTNCGLETVTLTLSHKFDAFRKKYMLLKHDQQAGLFNSMFGSFKHDFGTPSPKFKKNINFCENCGSNRTSDMKFCQNCGHEF